jgi:hypothetical protein
MATEEISHWLPTGHSTLDELLTPTDTGNETHGVVRF